MIPDIEITEVSIEMLRADLSGEFVEEWAALSHIVFGEPPWDENLKVLRLILGVGIDIMRENARAFSASTNSGRHIGHTLGYEVFRLGQGDSRRPSLEEISGTNEMTHLFNRGRLFYIDTFAVHPGFRRRRQRTGEVGVGERLSTAIIDAVRGDGFAGVVLRTDVEAEAARGIYTKLGFQDLGIHDREEQTRTYWMLEL